MGGDEGRNSEELRKKNRKQYIAWKKNLFSIEEKLKKCSIDSSRQMQVLC